MHAWKILRSALVLASAGLGTAALAVPPRSSHHKSAPAAAAGPADSQVTVPHFAELGALFDKLFPPQPAPDPTRLALAQTAVGAMWPDGAYGKMMTGLIGDVFDRMMQLKGADLEVLANGSGKVAPGAKADLSLHDKAAAKDPYFDQRMAAARQIISEESIKISAIVDPSMRNGLARAMARRFDAQQLADINRFFATPTGRLFAGQYMQLWIDPDTMRSVMASVPQLVKLMPEVAEKMKVVEQKFPKPAAPATPPAKP